MEEAKEDVRADIAVMRRAAEKADTEVSRAEVEKRKQVIKLLFMLKSKEMFWKDLWLALSKWFSRDCCEINIPVVVMVMTF